MCGASMSHPTDTPVKKMLRLSEAMANQIKRYRFRREIATETEAIRQLLAFALENDKTPARAAQRRSSSTP